MKKILSIIIPLTALAFVFAGCSDMNEKHELFMEEGERIYIGKVDSLKVFPGENCVNLRFWASDPRVKSVGFYWTPYSDSLLTDIQKTSPVDSFEVFIGEASGSNPIQEGSYMLKAVTYDNAGHSSIPYETTMTIYGDRYRSTLTNRVLSSMEYTNETGSLSLYFAGPLNEQDMGIEISYTDRDGNTQKEVIPNAEITSPVTFTNVDVEKGVFYRTMFLPEPTAIDTFFTDFSPIEIVEVVNVALNKPVQTSGNYNSKYIGPNAVDGIISEASRWLSARSGEHWIEIDLEEEYTINAIKTWTGSGGFNSPTVNFFFQAEINGEWVNILEITGNSDPQFAAVFSEVTTSKVRYFVPDYSGNMVRLFEIEVLATIRY